MLDDYSRFVRLVCQRHRDKETTIESFRSKWEADFYIPRRIRHDNDGAFVDLDAFLTAEGCKREEIPPHCPQLDGLNERSHSTLMAIYSATMAHAGLKATDKIRKLIMENHVANVYNNTVRRSTGQAPVSRALGLPAALEQAAAYYPGRPAAYRPDDHALHVPHGRQKWQTGRMICQMNDNLLAAQGETGKIWYLPTGRVRLVDPFSARSRAEIDKIPAIGQANVNAQAPAVQPGAVVPPSVPPWMAPTSPQEHRDLEIGDDDQAPAPDVQLPHERGRTGVVRTPTRSSSRVTF